MFMDNFLNLDIYESPIEEFIGIKEFNEFRSIMNMLDYYGTPHSILYEAVMDPGNAAKQGTRMAIRNTISTTSDVINAYDKTTTANANVLKATWDFIMKMVNLVVKGITKIMNTLANIPQMLSSTIDWVSGIPQKVRVKIRGDITLYITIEDINVLYNQSLLAYIVDIIGMISLVSQGDTWQKLFGKKKKVVDDKGRKSKINEHQLLRDINKLAAKIISIKFEPTVVKMNNEQVVNTYFSNSAKVVKFKDLSGTQHNDTYYEALTTLVKDITSKKKELMDVQSAMGVKIQDSRENNNFAQLDAMTRNLITDTFQTLSKVVSVVGNILRYVVTDVNTITKAAKKVRKKYNIGGMGESVYEEKGLLGKFLSKLDEERRSYEKEAHEKWLREHPTKKPYEVTEEQYPEESKLLIEVLDELYETGKREIITLDPGKRFSTDQPDKLKSTKFGGVPYWPEGMKLPTFKGRPMVMVAQLNFSELPKLKGYPSTGILQIFAEADDVIGGVKSVYHASTNAKTIAVPEVYTTINVSDRIDFDYPVDGVYYPKAEIRELSYPEIMSKPYEEKFLEIFNRKANTNCKSIYDIPGPINPRVNHTLLFNILDDPRIKFNESRSAYYNYTMIGAYPRYIQASVYTDKVCILQINRVGDVDWGDGGMLYIFIDENDLKARKFDKISWDLQCY